MMILRENLDKCFIFDNYIKNIAIIITKSEGINIKRKEEISFLFKNKFKIENILFTTKNMDDFAKN